MKKIIVQVYEVQQPVEAEKLIEIGVDHIGSVVSRQVWKNEEIKDTIDLIGQTSVKSSLIPLFSKPEDVFDILEYYRPDIVHFCEALTGSKNVVSNGSLSDEVLKNCEPLIKLQEQVRQRFPEIKIMRSIPIPVPGKACSWPVVELAGLFETVSDFFLTDTLLLNDNGESNDELQPVGGFVGITGIVCDWSVASKLVQASAIPVVLAGGISHENVFKGVVDTEPAGVDSCTGTNALDEKGQPIRFQKDIGKVKQLVEGVRRAEANKY
jgi:phosphoribosylanthranilate isomerase